MGKKILVQRRGRGTSQFRAASHKKKGSVKYRKLAKVEYKGTITGEVRDLVHDPGRGAPVARVLFEDGWGLVRASNTQPVLVLRYEAKTEEGLEKIKNTFINKLKQFPEVKLDEA